MAHLLCDLFYYNPETIYTDDMFNDMWNYNKREFISILFYLRRHKTDNIMVKGRGERKIFHQVIIWMANNKLQELVQIIPYIPDCGCWKDLLFLMGTPAEPIVIQLFGNQLIKDYYSYNMNVPGLISLASKWTPNENSSFDRKYNAFGKIAAFMKISKKRLRKDFLVPLRKYLGVTEQLITEKKWNNINYDMVPKLSLKLHSKTFKINDNIRFNQYLNSIHCDSKSDNKLEPFTNSQNTIFGIDVSGSMSGDPIILANKIFTSSGIHEWIPYRFNDDLMESNNHDLVPITNNIIGYQGNNYNLDECLQIANKMKKNHLIVITNLMIDISEFPKLDGNIHITYWVINYKPPTITNYQYITIIDGYDINVYNNINSCVPLSRENYKDSILKRIQEFSIIKF